jgi:nitrogenase molybdenum-iron protein alpha chain
MAKKKVNLELSNVENREIRLGSIVSWDGKASALVEASRYEARGRKKTGEGQCGKGCSGSGQGCRLTEMNMPFNQQTMCSHSIVGCQIGNIPDCILIEHSPIGCSAVHARFNLGYKIGLGRRGKPI